jgi:hypothetical protein
MKSSNYIIKLAVISLLIIINSCSKSDDTVDPILDEEIDDPIEETSLKFKSTTQNVTFDICTTTYCSVKQLSFLDENIGYAVTGVDIYKTTTGGENWEYFLNQDIVGKLIPISDNLMFLNVYDGILKSTTGGTSWSNIIRPLEFICQQTGSINPGIIHFVDENNGFIQDKCYKGQLYSTADSGNSWELIYNSNDEISEYYFEDPSNGFVIVNNLLYVTENGGADWVESERLPSNFNYVIKKEGLFLFPEGTPDVIMPEIVSPTISVTKFDTNNKGDIAIILYDNSIAENNWQLMLYVSSETPEWIRIDQLSDLSDPISTYSSIFLTDEKSMYIGKTHSGQIIKYYVE